MITSARRARRRLLARPRLAALTVGTLAGAGIPALGLMAAPAGALPNPYCTGTVNVTCVFAATGSDTTWKVPFGVTSLTVIADGGSGASASSTFVTGGGAGGAGGEYKATLSNIHFPTTLGVFPGSAATGRIGGVNGAGRGGNSGRDTNRNTGGGGGGASLVAVTPASLSTVLVVAGGGGGGSAENQAANTPGNGGTGGGSSNATGGNGGTGIASTTNGKGGSPTVPGAGGAGPSTGCTTPAPGVRLSGGRGQTNPGAIVTCGYAGGGGGSGWFGGGGGGTGGGGGGGSAFPASTTAIDGITVTPQADTNTNTGDGSVTIKYRAVVNNTQLTVFSQRTGLGVTLFARLTANGQPVPGEPITFSTGVVQWCTGEITSNSGIASCSLSPYETALLRDQFGVFSAYFGGDTPGGLPPASATGVAAVGGFFF
jgi:Glycine rich protein